MAPCLRPLRLGLAILASLWPGLPFPAAAESTNACSGRVVVSFVYAVMIRRDAYEYRAYIRNLTRDRLGWTLSLGSFPPGTSPPLEHPMRGVLAPHAGETLRIGRGPTAAISLDAVEVLYDRTGGAKPFISLRACTPHPG
jgi:hypothetical protein